jgi:hypothetical protein
VERIARHQGLPVTEGQDAEEVIRAAVLRWRGGLNRWLGDRLAGPLDWDESAPAPCFTDKPGWDGYGGALRLAAHDEHPELPPPAVVSADWPDDPAYQAPRPPGGSGVSPRTGCGRRTGRTGPRRSGGRGASGWCGSAR